ncbi:uncharacterized protein [Periplaneta americana]|uniref:uncharacterized protein isoform X2 n=1 Tax=Periplaneta americana TaxID=6978 RepID=UPI0037E85D7E
MIRYLTLWPTVSLLKSSNIWAVAMMRAVYKMPLFNQPLRLEKLSLHSLVKYLSDTCVCLVNSCRTSSASLQEALATCQRLSCIIHDKIPHCMANRITNEALEYLSCHYNVMKDSINHSSSSKNILQHFVNAILHPQVTELDIVAVRMVFVNAALNQIETLSQLKIFRACLGNGEGLDLFEQLLLEHLPSLKNLKRFTLSRWSSNEIISVLSKSAPGLTHLDVGESEDVTDKSIDVILKFAYLQSLNVSNTGISDHGYKRLLDRSRSCLHLQDFGLNFVDSSHILSLPDRFQGLRRLSLNVGNLEINLDDIAELLQGLEELKLCASHVPALPYFSTLKVLVLDVCKLDIQDLPTSCPCLEKLIVKTISLYCSAFKESFTHLNNLSVWVGFTDSRSIDALLSAAPNLVAFHFNTGDSRDIIAIVKLFSKSLKLNWLENLSVFSVNGSIDLKTLSLVTHRCSRLTTCNVCVENREFMRNWYWNFTGVKIYEVKWCWMHLHHLRL